MKATALHRVLGVLIQYLTVELNNLSCAFKQTGAPGPCRSNRPYFAGSDAVVLQLRQLELVPHGEVPAVWYCAPATKSGEIEGCLEGLQKSIALCCKGWERADIFGSSVCLDAVVLQQPQLEVVSVSKA